MLSQHTTQSGLSVCTCNEELADLLLCEDDQESVVIRVSWGIWGKGGGERERGHDFCVSKCAFHLSDCITILWGLGGGSFIFSFYLVSSFSSTVTHITHSLTHPPTHSLTHSLTLSLTPTQRGKWAVYVPTTPRANLHFYPCPTGYCRCRHDTSVSNTTCIYSYLHSDPDSQCACSRRGRPSLSLSLPPPSLSLPPPSPPLSLSHTHTHSLSLSLSHVRHTMW